MKTSKLKYVLVFVLLVAISVVSTNVYAVSYGPIKVSIIEMAKHAIVDGDETEVKTIDRYVTVENTSWSSVAADMNPVQKYTITDKEYSATNQAFSLAPSTVTEQDAEFTYGGNVANANIGLAMAYGYRTYTSGPVLTKALQLYIWNQNQYIAGGVEELQAHGDGSYACYMDIANFVTKAQARPSYTYADKNTAKANAYEMTWSEENERYEIRLTDTEGLDTSDLINLIISANSGVQYTKDGNTVVFYSYNQLGSQDNPVYATIDKSINGGKYVAQTVQSLGKDYVYLTWNSYDNNRYYAAFYTNSMKLKIHKTKTSSATNPNTGDATVEGAIYGVYKDSACTQLVQRITTDRNGYAETSPIEFRDYYVKELTASEGCLLDTVVKTANKNTYTVGADGVKLVSVDCTENVIYGGFRMIVSVNMDEDDEQTTTKVLAQNSEITLKLISDESQVYVKRTDDRGYVEFTDIPYGKYICKETEKADNVPNIEKIDYMDDMLININSTEMYQYSEIVDTEVAERYVKISKLDAESGKLVTETATTYKVTVEKEGVEQQVVLTNMYPDKVVRDTFVTATEDEVLGYCGLPEKLPYGTYHVYELIAPYGYYNESIVTGEPSATFRIETNTPEDNSKPLVSVETRNVPQKGILTITAKGEVLTSTNTQTSYGQSNVQRPTYTVRPIAGVVYQLTADEDIVTGDGTVHMRKGDVITLDPTDENGVVCTDTCYDEEGNKKNLYIGAYTLTMLSAPKGYAVDRDERLIHVDYQGQTIKEFNLAPENYRLVRQKFDLSVSKTFIGLDYYKKLADGTYEALDKDAYQDVIVGIYAKEDITNVYGTVIIPANTLVDVVVFDENKEGIFASDYPVGKFYAKEIETNINYQLSETEYVFEVKANSTWKENFNISLENIENQSIKDNRFTLVKFERLEEDESPNFIDRFVEALEDIFSSKLDENSILDDLESINAMTLEGAKFAFYVPEGSGVPGAEYVYYPLVKKIGDNYVEVVGVTDEDGILTVTDLPYGDFSIKEVEAPRFYNLNENRYGLSFTPDHKVIELGIENERILVDVGFTLVDEDGVKLENVGVELVDPVSNKTVYKALTDEEGHASFVQVRAGEYLRKVTGLPECYVTPKAKEVVLEEDNELVLKTKVKYVRGNILINKTDDETGEAVPECLFTIKDEAGEVVAEARTDDNGQLLIANLRYGVYYVEETEAAENYEKSDLVYEVTITENGHTYVVDYTNVPTGDMAVALYAVLALMSVAAIVVTSRKLKRD